MQSEIGKNIVPTEKKWFMRGFLLNMSNPKSVLAWMATLSIEFAGDGASAIITVTAVYILVRFATHALYSILFSVGGMMRGDQKCRHWISGIAVALFTLAGVSLIRSAFAR